jgi:SAM-dependent methyltransferase
LTPTDGSESPAGPLRNADIIWHDAECGGYEADLALWEALANDGPGPILDLGCGTGRVSAHLARRGHEVTGIDIDPALVGALNARAVPLVSAVVADARDFSLAGAFGLILAPMQLMQLFADSGERAGCMRSVARHLTPGGLFAASIVEHVPEEADPVPVLPDAVEIDGWVYSSLPVDLVIGAETMVIRRLRQTVSPGGTLTEEVDEIELCRLAAATLEEEARSAALRPAGRRLIPLTDTHVGSTAVLLQNEG